MHTLEREPIYEHKKCEKLKLTDIKSKSLAIKGVTFM